MINKKIKKIILLIILTLCIAFFNTEIIYAKSWGGSGGGPSTGTGNGGDGDGGSGKCSGAANCPENITACCSVSKGYNVWSEITVDAYDMNGNKIYEGDYINQNILAGTYVGLDVYEKKGYSSWASYSISAIQTYYICTKTTCSKCQVGDYPDGKPKYGTCCKTDTKEEIYGCPSGYSSSKNTRSAAPCASQVSACKASATPMTIELKPSYNISYQDSNDIEGNTTGEYNTAENITGSECTKIPKESSNGNKRTKSNECIFYYNREASCINVINGKVRYIKRNDECKNDEYKIVYNDDYWKYFIPLNANSKKGFSFIMNSSGNKERPEICVDYINKYPNYAEIITDSNGMAFTGKESKQHALSKVANGCYYQTTVTIPIEQRFYNELENGINFEGFNFYYRPIDINEPFPNGLNNNSIWYDWNKNTNKKPNISKSYNEVTYIADVAENTTDIRNYKKNCGEKSCEYTSWYNMNVDGSSNFIQDKDYIIRKVQNKSYYSLGCGPWNEKQYNENGSKNAFYQPECDNS